MKNLLFVFCFCCSHAYAQEDSTEVKYNPKDDFSITGFPLVFYLPETNLAFGALGMTVFNAGKNKAWRKSQVQLGLAYTLKKQFLLFVPYELYFKDNWKLGGELGYYRYFYNYYGIGAKSLENDLETYDANFPRLISSLLYRFNDKVLAGFQYRLDVFDIPNIGPLLANENPVGIGGGTISTVGIATSFDSRDDIFYPRKGVLVNLNTEHSGALTGSSYNYSTISIDATWYQTIFENQVIVSNLFLGNSAGNLPYFNYFYLSSGKRGRGFNDRRFIDKNMALLQVEYRFPIYKRFRGVAFASSGTVSPSTSELFKQPQKIGYGAGLRFQLSKKQLNHLRLDVARSQEGFQFYITIGEAF
ncbi:MAG: BamA/TamA family outer membrane protein [Crocinitomicaceae bacterium]